MSGALRFPRARPSGFRAAVVALGTLGVAVRALMMVGYWPANVSHPDTASYVDAAAHSLFSNPFRPAGYSLFLRALHRLSPGLWFTVVVQHAIGLAAALLAYCIARQIRARPAVALVPAAVMLLSGDQLYLEHSLLSDGLFLAMVLTACILALSIRDTEPASTWRGGVVVTGAALVTALSGTVRTVGVALVPVLIIWLLGQGGVSRAIRVRQAAAATAVCLIVLLGYAAAQDHATGVFGLSRFSAWPLYARVAPISDCRRFTPPPETGALCESTPPGQRPGPDFYLWNSYSPAQRFVGFPPSHGAVVGAFARATILHEPLTYVVSVARDLARYVYPSLVTRPQWGADPRSLALNQPWDAPDAWGLPRVTGYYGGARIRVRQGLMDALEAWLSPFRIHGALIAVAALLSAAALRLSPDARARRGVMLLVGFAAVLFVVPTATASYEARYGVPGSVLLVIASARGTELVVGRLRQIRAKWLDGGVEPTALWSARQPAAARARRAGRAFARHVARQLPL